ncbi:MAG TPA: alpha/beta hydrolase [Lacisediminihabitans sp.]|uniref:alpha/beta fold hydrolase n=1 Tax=Lacisediminihabitans sp. TaxID=2787631 RepID=UPI002ED7CE1D
MAETINPLDGTRIAFEESGSGEPLLLVHGSALSKAIWRGLGYVRALRDEYRVISIDLRGHGRSAKPDRPEAYRMDAVSGDVLAVLDTLGIDAAHYFGYSFGARIGFSLIDRHPERVISFVSAGGTYRSPGGSVAELFFPGYETALAEGGMPGFVRAWGEASGRPIDPQTAAAMLANDAPALLAYFRQLENEPGLPDARLPLLETPTLLLAATRDRRRLADSERAAELMPHATFHELPGQDHGGTLRDVDTVLGFVVPFLRTAGSGGAE